MVKFFWDPGQQLQAELEAIEKQAREQFYISSRS
jgi:hypothetical protein